MKNIRNFCIIAHIDHGKSTLADRLLELTHTVDKRDMRAQHLDTMDLEQERGITIKLQPARMEWKNYELNLIDTPGHADFAYEVSRSLKAVEGALLIIDATQGIEAQTLANVYAALEANLEIIPVINKIDLPAADVPRIKTEIENVLSIPREEVIEISAKEGTNCEQILDAVVERIPPPQNLVESEGTKALIFDSIFDPYRGVVIYVRNFAGEIKKGDKLKLLRADAEFEALEVGCFKPKYLPTEKIEAGEIGYIVTGLKSVRDARVGETVWGKSTIQTKNQAPPEPLPGYKKVSPFVFAGVFANDANDFPELRDALEKLSLNDASLTYEPERSSALGFGFRVGFLGLLHLEIVQERLEREYNLDLIVTAPSVKYEMILNSGEVKPLANPSELPDVFEELHEPWVKLEIVTPKKYLGGVLELVTKRRGVQKNLSFLDADRALVEYEIPLASIITDFYDKLKNVSSGYASMSYEFLEFRTENLVRLDVLIGGEKIDALSFIAHRSEARSVGMNLCKKLKDIIPRANFVIPIQAAIGATVIARETLSAYRKDVTAKLYGGDVTRKNKLLKKQKAGKKRMKQFGKVSLPQEAFLAVLKRDGFLINSR
ncbi:translation elongation factor 4 [Candidatus Gracilibacteria bacterium]|nr:translation elongation factor 4 [Candidatus Gracilibacteria bacterium]MCF7856470.1 translation elongation factor 4 [Candidatus Gracilibacteria bacterium]MCF7896766.1 translation elongation factor 4 [Candidatus Gracilibacteria bacterium]